MLDGSFSYAPAPDFFGSVSFTYVANDGAADSNVATVSIMWCRSMMRRWRMRMVRMRRWWVSWWSLMGRRRFDLDGTIVSFEWDFGDGSTGSGVSPSHTYASSGLYVVSLTVTDDGGLSDTATSSADIGEVPNDAPVADADGPYVALVGELVVFDGSGSVDLDGSIVTFEWDFGDGSTGSGVSPSHTYSSAGLYVVSLTVTDDGGLSDTATSSADIGEVPNARAGGGR